VVNHSSTSLSSGALKTTDEIVLQTLEGRILPLLLAAPLSLHNPHFKTSVTPGRYEDGFEKLFIEFRETETCNPGF
jgi:hypothetical protein